MSAASHAVAVSGARSWPAAFGAAAIALWGPAIALVVLLSGEPPGLLAACMPTLPGSFVPALCGVNASAAFFTIAGAVTVAMLGVLAVALRELPRGLAIAAQGLAALFVFAQALVLAAMLRA
jgi:hypothetical protein